MGGNKKVEVEGMGEGQGKHKERIMPCKESNPASNKSWSGQYQTVQNFPDSYY